VIGKTISHYTVVEALGAGGMGVVYRAHDLHLDRDVAIKVLPSELPRSEKARLRFRREATSASALNHPNIVTIYEVSNDGPTDFIVMEYVRGATIAALVKSRSLTVEEVLHYSMQIADALTKAHAVGVIHRDLKPGNIMVTEDGLIKVLDFGLAKLVREPDKAEVADQQKTKEFTLTQPGMVTGTMYYMSPEQARGDTVDARTDIFSLGTVIFEMLTGKLPFTGTNSMQVLHSLHFSPPRNLSELRVEVPPELVSLIGRMLEKEPEKRVQTMAEVLRELRRNAKVSMDGSRTWDKGWLQAASNSPKAKSSAWKRWLMPGFAILLVLLGAYGIRRWAEPSAAPVQTSAPLSNLPPDADAYALYQRARQDLDNYGGNGRVDQAIQFLDRAIQKNPQSAVSFGALSEAYYFKNRLQNPDPQWVKLTSEYAAKAVALEDDLGAAHVAQGIAKMQAGDIMAAEREFQHAAELDPKNSAPQFWLGSLYSRTNKPIQAEESLKRALRLNPSDMRAQLQLGGMAYQQGKYQDAISSFEEVRKAQPDNLIALQDLGAVYHSVGRDDDAAAALQQALAIKPTADIYNNLATLRFFQGHYQDAVPAFEKAVELGANHFDNWANLGDAYRWTPGGLAKANQAYDQAIRLVKEEIAKHPDQIELNADLAMYLAKRGDKQAALTALQPVEQSQSKDGDVLYDVAQVYEICGKREPALNALAGAVKAGRNLEDVKNDPEFVALRADPRYHLEVLSVAPQKQ
jgi:serine/threonine protein kinase